MSTPGYAAARPAAVTRAVQLSYVMAALSVIGAIVVLATTDTSAITQQTTAAGVDAATAGAITSSALVAGLVVAIIGAVLRVVFALLAGRGKNWARIVSVVLAALSIIGGLTSLGGGAASALFGIIQVVLAVLVIVFFFRPGVSAWYASLKGAPTQGYGQA